MSLLDQAQRFFAALNAQDLDQVVSMISPVCDIRTPQGTFTGGEAYRDWISGLFRALPDFTHELRGIAVESGPTIAFELHAAGTFTGPLAMPGGDVAPNGRFIDVPGADLWRFEDGKIVEYHLYFDQMEFLTQLGIAPGR